MLFSARASYIFLPYTPRLAIPLMLDDTITSKHQSLSVGFLAMRRLHCLPQIMII